MTEQHELTRMFSSAFADTRAEFGDDVELLPHRLARAAASCLDVGGAALSVHQGPDRRVAIGTSDEMAALAERLQFTMGSGPALDVAATGRVIAAYREAVWRRWSPFAAELFAQTPIESIVTVPLAFGEHGQVTLDLYLLDHRLGELRLQDLALVGDLVVDALGAAAEALEQWFDGSGTRSRHETWIVIGRLTESLGVDPRDALDLMRARALLDGSDVDAVAAQVTDGTLAFADLSPESGA